jgi:hypothetical protein
MAEIIPFPVIKRLHSGHDIPQPVPEFSFSADFSLVNGRDVAFTIEYPDGPIHWKLVAAMLRRTAGLLENPPPTRV